MADTFSNFDTDYSGAQRFKDIMENGGNVDVTRIRDFIEESVNYLADNGKDAIKHLECGNGLSIVVAWETAPETEAENAFIDGGYEICASVRETNSGANIEEWKSLVGSVALTEDDEANGYSEIADELYVQIMDNDPETVDIDGQVRDETVYDELEDFQGAFNEWKESINNDGTIHIEDINLEKVTCENGQVLDGVVFTLDEDLTGADIIELDEYFTRFMPESIKNFILDKDFNYEFVGRRGFAFIAW